MCLKEKKKTENFLKNFFKIPRKTLISDLCVILKWNKAQCLFSQHLAQKSTIEEKTRYKHLFSFIQVFSRIIPVFGSISDKKQTALDCELDFIFSNPSFTPEDNQNESLNRKVFVRMAYEAWWQKYHSKRNFRWLRWNINSIWTSLLVYHRISDRTLPLRGHTFTFQQ